MDLFHQPRGRTRTCSRVAAWPVTSRTTSRPRSSSGSARSTGRSPSRCGSWSTRRSAPPSTTTRSGRRRRRSRRSPQRLRKEQLDGAYGVRFGQTGRGRPWGNTVVGLRNAAAPPLVIEHSEAADGNVWSDFHLGAAYEGPPGLVHGGVSSMILDQMLGEAAGAGGKPGMTATLTLTYRQGTPLGDLRAEAWIERSAGLSRPGPRATSSVPTASPSRPRGCSSCPSGRASADAGPGRRRLATSSSSADLDAADAGVGEPRLLEGLLLELAGAGPRPRRRTRRARRPGRWRRA